MKQTEPHRRVSRRQFLHRSAGGVAWAGVAGMALPAAVGAAKETDPPAPDAVTKPPTAQTRAGSAGDQPGGASPLVQRGEMPAGKLGSLKLSRILSGGNILSGWCHSRDLLFVRTLAQAYLTPRRQFDTLQLMEELGINAIVLDMIQLDIVKQYRKERGARMQTVVGIRPDWGDWSQPAWGPLKTEIQRTIDQGPETLFVHGGYADRLVQSGKSEAVELIGKAIQFIREQGYPAGLGSHALEVPMACDKQGIAPDYYFKTFHHDRYWSATPRDRRKRFCVDGQKHLDHNEFHDNIFCIDPEETLEFMREKPQPWIAFKVLAAGAIPPASGFQYAFDNGADFLAVGMFDFEVAEDLKIAREVLQNTRRERPWRS